MRTRVFGLSDLGRCGAGP